MSVRRILPRGLFSPSVHLRPASRLVLHTSSNPTPAGRQPVANTTIQNRRIASMPKEVRAAQDHRLQPIKQRQRRTGALASNMPPGTSFNDMAKARIGILQDAIASINMHANGPEDTEKKTRHREKKISAHTAEIQDLRRQIEYGYVLGRSFTIVCGSNCCYVGHTLWQSAGRLMYRLPVYQRDRDKKPQQRI